jgi:hypothetical protein
MMIPVVYNYRCTCGYHYATQEQVQAGSYIRLLINSVLLCPECKQRLQPQVQVAYGSLPTDESEVSGEQREEQVG